MRPSAFAFSPPLGVSPVATEYWPSVDVLDFTTCSVDHVRLLKHQDREMRPDQAQIAGNQLCEQMIGVGAKKRGNYGHRALLKGRERYRTLCHR
jgi:hypothetical protein